MIQQVEGEIIRLYPTAKVKISGHPSIGQKAVIAAAGERLDMAEAGEVAGARAGFRSIFRYPRG